SAVDAAGNAFVTGYTTSTDFPTRNALQPKFPTPTTEGTYAPLVSKIGNDGSLAYSSYLGAPGPSQDPRVGRIGTDATGIHAVAYAVGVDSFGNIYVAGHTKNGHFPPTRGA